MSWFNVLGACASWLSLGAQEGSVEGLDWNSQGCAEGPHRGLPGRACRRDADGHVGAGPSKTHRAYLWAYAAGAFEPLCPVVYDFTESRAVEHARAFLGDWRGGLGCDDYTGYKASFALGVIEAGGIAHARRKFVELHQANKGTIAAAAIDLTGQLYGIEREV